MTYSPTRNGAARPAATEDPYARFDRLYAKPPPAANGDKLPPVINRVNGLNSGNPYERRGGSVASVAPVASVGSVDNHPLPDGVMEAIRATLPDRGETLSAAVWRAVGRMKSLPVKWPATALLASWREWHRQAEPFLEVSAEEVEAEFGSAWDARKFAHGVRWQAEVEKALASPCPHVAADLGITAETPRRLMTLLAFLQRRDEFVGKPFGLSGYQAGDAVGVKQPYAWKWLRTFVAWKLLEVVEPGERRPGGRATTWLWLGGN